MSSNWKCIVRYDGTDFAGWQIQPGRRTVQGVIESTLAQIARVPVKIAGAGRTDAGVHALGQVFNFHWPEGEPPRNLMRSLNSLLYPEVSIESMEPVPEDFHASFNATGKRYAYVISTSRSADPFLSRYAWTPKWEIDRSRFSELAQRVTGEHDFAGFCCSRSSATTTVRTIHSVTVRDGGIVAPIDAEDLWHVEFHGNGFLYKMIRNLVGTLSDIARGHLPESALHERLNAPAPYRGNTVLAKGLFMLKVEYDKPHNRHP
jgi:tRNA pseudouridine38-40 synthase